MSLQSSQYYNSCFDWAIKYLKVFFSGKEGRVKKNENMKEMGNTVELEINSTNSIVDEI